MAPTFRDLDILYLKPYGIRPVKVGDIIAFRKPVTGIIVIHRVVGIKPGEIVTRGDNRSRSDPRVVGLNDIIGYITAYERNGTKYPVYSGMRGRMAFRLNRWKRTMKRNVISQLGRIYSHTARTRIVSRLITPFMGLRIRNSVTETHSEIQLVFLEQVIGILPSGAVRWNIRFPFALFVDEMKLSELIISLEKTTPPQVPGE